MHRSGLDHEAAMAQLEACLLTPAEMAAGKKRWLALPDPYADPREKEQAAMSDVRAIAWLTVGLVSVVLVYACLLPLLEASFDYGERAFTRSGA